MGIKKVLGKIGKTIAWPFVHFWPVIKPVAVRLAKEELGKIVFKAVANLENSDLSPSQRFDAAFQDVIAQAKKSGVDYKNSMVNFLIELAVQALKNGFKP